MYNGHRMYLHPPTVKNKIFANRLDNTAVLLMKITNKSYHARSRTIKMLSTVPNTINLTTFVIDKAHIFTGCWDMPRGKP